MLTKTVKRTSQQNLLVTQTRSASLFERPQLSSLATKAQHTHPSPAVATGFNFGNIPVLQANLRIGRANDNYEQEADRVADQVMRMPASAVAATPAPPGASVIPRTATCAKGYDAAAQENRSGEQDTLCSRCQVQGKPLAGQITPLIQRETHNAVEEEEEETPVLQTKPLAQTQTENKAGEEDEQTLQTTAAPGRTSALTPGIMSGIAAMRGQGQSLTPATRGFMEPRFGRDFTQVRVHADGNAARLSKQINARAFTVGQDIAFGAGYYQPNTSGGRKLLAHELTHVVQQTGVLPLNPKAAKTNTHINNRMVLNQQNHIQRNNDSLPSVTIDNVNAPDTPPGTSRIPPTAETGVRVNMAGWHPPLSPVKLSIMGAGGGNGTVKINGGNTHDIVSSQNVLLKGDNQTAPGKAGKLKLVAHIGPDKLAESNAFSVAAYPRNWVNTFHSDVNGASVGVKVSDNWSSDGSGAITDLSEVQVSELVGLDKRDNPPFSSGSGTSTTSGTSGYLSGNSLTTDTHSYPKSLINSAGIVDKTKHYKIVYTQLILFKCNRTAVTDIVMPASGYTITHNVWWNSGKSKWIHNTVKAPGATTVGSYTTTAGAGTATSLDHEL